MDRYLTAFDRRYGAARDADDFAFRSQAFNYENMRAMFEAFAANRPVTTGIIQWMHNAAWPKLYWQFYDYFLMPTGAFYGARKANQPLTLLYHYGNKNIYLVNQSLTGQSGLQAVISVYDAGSKRLFYKTITVDATANTSKDILTLPQLDDLSKAWFLDLRLQDSIGRTLADNFYWLSTQADVPDFENSQWFVTPSKEYADLTLLNSLPEAQVNAEHRFSTVGQEQEIEVTLHNSGENIAFCIELGIYDEHSGKTLVPVFWEDNYVSLLPGESRTICASFACVGSEKPVFRYRGWNVKNK
jgi:exo-1,4-beta-D-glucosaminidase